MSSIKNDEVATTNGTNLIHTKLGNITKIAVDPLTIVIKECLLISSSMRKSLKYSQSGVAAILGGGGASDLFQDDETHLHKYGLSGSGNGFSNDTGDSRNSNDPILSGFIQLRLMLNTEKSLDDIDSLTLLQPFLLLIKSSSTSGAITSLALDSIFKFLNYGIISSKSKNLEFTLTHTINLLTHCRFEASNPASDDAVLLKVLNLLERIVNSEFGPMLSDEAIYEVVQTSLSLACNKRRTEVLRKAAELSMYSVSAQIFKKLDQLQPEQTHHLVEDTQDFTKDQLIGTIGAIDENDLALPKKSIEVSTNTVVPFGLQAIKQFLGILISMISQENQLKHTESTKVFALSLINSSVEMYSNRFHFFPSLLNLYADQVFKHTVQIIQTSNSLSVLQAALQLFTTLTLTLGGYLQPQIELALISIFDIVLPPAKDTKKENAKPKSGKSTPVENIRPASVKELLIEEISILWTRTPSFFTSLFINYDCNFHRHDITIRFLEFLAEISLPESATYISDQIPPICLEGVLSFINNLTDLVKVAEAPYDDQAPKHELILTKLQKKEFIAATAVFNEKPKDGLKVLAEKGFLKDPNDLKELAKFFFEKSSRLNKKVLGEYLGKSTNIDLLIEFMNNFDFEGLRVDEALRILLKTFRLPGESQQIERVVENFAARYVECQHYKKKVGAETETEANGEAAVSEASVNSTKEGETVEEGEKEEALEPVEPDADAVFVLSYSIIMLNTDSHNPNIKAHMTIEDYNKNLRGVYGGKDFPSWYLEKIYKSIQDKEIVMPEEHHGSSQWFDDSWNNLISANSSIVNETYSVDDFDNKTLLQFNKLIYQATFEKISSTIFKIFAIASDDQVITRIMTTIDRLSQISSYFNLVSYNDEIAEKLTEFTNLTKKYGPQREDGSPTIKMTNIKVQNSSTISVTETSYQFGNDFKAQLSAVILFRIAKRDLLTLNKSWNHIIQVLLNLYNCGLMEPDIYPEFQQFFKLSKLAKVKPNLTITRSSATKGLFSTFASYLKGDEEPTDEEVEATLSAIDCIKSCSINKFFEILKKSISSNTSFLDALISSIPDIEKAKEYDHFEYNLLFTIEVAINLVLSISIKQEQLAYNKKLIAIINHTIERYTADQHYILMRLITYVLILAPVSTPEDLDPILPNLFVKVLKFDNVLFEKKSQQLIYPLCNLLNKYDKVILDENYWKVLRIIGSMSEFSADLYQFIEKFIKDENNLKKFKGKSFMSLLGLLDEISAVGAIGGQWEQEYDLLVTTGHKVDKENPYQDIVQLSIKSINSTSSLLNNDLSKEGKLALIQALAHQCLNPCFQIRSHALNSLEETIYKIEIDEGSISVADTFELGLFPLINEDIPKYDILSIISKVFVHFLKDGQNDDQIYLKILDFFNQYIEDPKIEDELQKLISVKKEFERENSPDKQKEAESKEIGQKIEQIEEEIQKVDIAAPETNAEAENVLSVE